MSDREVRRGWAQYPAVPPRQNGHHLNHRSNGGYVSMGYQDSADRLMDNGGSPDNDQQSNRSGTPQDSDRDGSHQSPNGHSPRPAGRSRSRSHDNTRRRRSRSGSPRKSRKYGSSREPRRSSRRSNSPGRRRHSGNRENPPAGRCLGIFGLSIYTQERDLRDTFGKFGPIEDVQIVYDAQTNRSRGFAFVYFQNKNDAAEAKDHCNGIEIDGRKIRVDFSITQRAHTPTPGIYMGKPTHPRYRGGDRSGGGDRGGYRSYRGGPGGSGGYHGGGGYHSHGRRSSPPSAPHYRDRRGGPRYSRSRSRSFSPRPARHYR